MRLMDLVTIIALVIGPLLAVALQLGFEQRREKRKRKLSILDNLMSYRGRLVHTDSVRAINLIDLVFYDNKEVRRKFAVFMNYLESDAMKADEVSPEAGSKAEDLAAELISEIAKDVGYSFDHTLIKRQAYRPRAFSLDEKFTKDVRESLLPVLRGEQSIQVIVNTLEPESGNE